MKKKNLAIAGIGVILVVAALLFFSKSKQQRFVEKELSSMQEKGSYISFFVAEEALATEESYSLPLPAETEYDYVNYLTAAISKIDFDVQTDGDKVSVSFEPADLKKTMEPLLKKESMEISTPIFSEAIKTALKKETKELEHLKRQSGTNVIFELKEDEEGYYIPKEDVYNLIRASLPGYFDTYLVLEEIFDKQDYLKAFLDANLKGDTKALAEHLSMTKEEVDAWYRQPFEGVVQGFSEEDTTRLTNALMRMSESSQYIVGIPRKSPQGGYDIEVNITPNLSNVKAKEEVDSMEFSSKEEVVQGYLTVYEKYADHPEYGESFDTVFHWDETTTFADLSPGTYVGDFLGTIYEVP